MRRDTVVIAVVLLLTLFAVGAVLLLPMKAHAEGSRLYHYTGLRYRMQDGEQPKIRAELGTAFSAGRFAPALTGSLGLDGRLSPGLDVSLRYRF